MKSPASFIWIGLLLLIAWIVLRVALAVTGFALHLLWIAAIISFGIWVVKRTTGNHPA